MRDAQDNFFAARNSDTPVEQLIRHRWSARAMSGQPLKLDHLRCLLDAARWAPSSSNTQPWRFLYALPTSTDWQRFVGFLVEGNRIWAQKAGALFVVCSLTRIEAKDRALVTHAFDTGAANQNLALQGMALGLVVHSMGGFDRDATRRELGIPELYAVQCMVAVGYPGAVADLPAALRERETPSGRNSIDSFAFEGAFPLNDSANGSG